eukprot:11703428-Alexandrium_andersonii.AAC.1
MAGLPRTHHLALHARPVDQARPALNSARPAMPRMACRAGGGRDGDCVEARGGSQKHDGRIPTQGITAS